ncbi:MAG: hypothetical protein GXP42_19070 [Chloroflexi bacterium]|nr:hypothetical protein [Chloroflexota bacterium]
MQLWRHYHLAQSIPDALRALAEAEGPASIIAGGTDLLLDLEQGRRSPVHTLVDVTRIEAMRVVEIRNASLFVGAAAPLNQIVASPLVAEHAQALNEACALIGGPQVRNAATLGGNVAHALPAADGTIALTALNAQAEIATQNGRRLTPLIDLFLGPGQSALNPQEEMLTGFLLPLRARGEASAFRRVMRPQGVAIAILNMGVWLRREGDRIVKARISVGPSGPTPRRLRATEQALCGRSPTSQVLAEAAQTLLREARFRTSRHRATTTYRQHVAAILLEETLLTAWERAGAG